MSAENAATADVQAFEAACAALTEAESALRRAQELACELEAKADQLDREAAELDQQRGRALARGKMDDARKIGQKWEGAHDGAKAARAEASALRTAIENLEIALLDAEEAAQRAHRLVLIELHDRELAALIDDIRPRTLRLYRAHVARGGNRTFGDWIGDIVRDCDPGSRVFHEPLAEPLPVPEDRPDSELLGFGRARRSAIADRREARQQRAAA